MLNDKAQNRGDRATVPADKPIIDLLLDSNTLVGTGDRPIFGVSVTIAEHLKTLIGRVLMPGVVIGWVNYVDVSKFACLTSDKFYLEAADYIYTKHNQIVLARALKIHSVQDDVKDSKHILSFSEV